MMQMINKRSKGYVPYLYIYIKYQSLTFYIIGKTKLHFKYLPKEKTKETNTNKEEQDKWRKLFKF